MKDGRYYRNLGYPTLWGTGKVRLMEFLREHAPDVPLDRFDTARRDRGAAPEHCKRFRRGW
jgi:hypothetical protein